MIWTYRVPVACAGAGASANQAIMSFNVDDLGSPALGPGGLANFLAFVAGYGQCSANCTFEQVSRIPTLSVGSGFTDVPFPATEYAALQALDVNVPLMPGYGSAFGSGDLTVLGAGAVIRKQAAFPGRHGRGRMTTPWITKNAVDNGGTLGPGIAVDIAAAAEQYLITNCRSVLRYHETSGPSPIVSTTPIVAYTVDDRLGRLRSRSR